MLILHLILYFFKFSPCTIWLHTNTLCTISCFSLVDGSKKVGNTLSSMWKSAKSMFNQQTTAAGIGRKSSLVDQQQQQQQSGRSSTALPTNQSPRARDVGTNGHGKKGRGLAKVHPLDGPTTPAASADADETIEAIVHRKTHYEVGNEPRPRSYSLNSALFASDPTLPVPRAVEPGQSLPTSPRAARKTASFEKHQKQHQQQPHQRHSRKHPSPSSDGHVRPHSRQQSSSHSSADSPATGCAHHTPESDLQPHANPRPVHPAPTPASAQQCSTASAATPANESAGGNDKQPPNDGTLVDDVLSALAARFPEMARPKGHEGQRGVEQRPTVALKPQNTSESSLLNSKQQLTPEVVTNASRVPATAAAPTPPRPQTPDSECSSTNL